MIDTSKVIHAPVGGGRYTVTAPIVKEDYGLYLKIEGLELPSTYEVDFSNSEHNGTSVTMIGNSDGVLIPSQFISSGKDVFAFLYHVGADYGRTVYKFRIPNKVRPDRTNEQPTPEQQSVIDQAIAALNDAVEQTAQDVIDADASASAASQSESNAHDSELAAQGYANDAQGYAQTASDKATLASQKATAASNSADQAAQIKTDIEGYVSTAQGYAQTASDKASQASQSATTASNKANEASGYANTASQKASDASGYATTASNKATEASGHASTASTKAGEASNSASTALGYKTDAENAKIAAQTAQGLAESARDLAQGYAEDAQGYANDAQASAEGISASASQIAQNTANILKAFPTDTASGAVASFSDGADNIPLKSLIVNIDPVQDTSSGDPSPTNICPISGWTGCNVKHWSKNWIDNASNTYSLTTSNFAKYTPSASLKDITSGTFSVSANVPSGQTLKLFGYDGRNNNSFGTLVRQTDGRYSVTSNWTTFKNTVQFRVYSQPYTGGSSVVTEISDAMLVVNDAATVYEPYQGQTIPISWQTEAGTVYGGKLDVLSGELVIDRAMVTFDGSENWTPQNGVFTLYLGDAANIYKAGTTSQQNIVIADRFKPNGVKYRDGCGDGNIIKVVGNNTQIACYSSVYSSVDAFKSSLDDNPMQIVYVLATPIEIQLDAHTVKSLLGANNIFADAGDTSAEYRADTTLYISRLTEPDADMIADSNIVSGQYFMVGNSLFKATANIASGASVIVGTNAIRKSLSEALNEINS